MKEAKVRRILEQHGAEIKKLQRKMGNMPRECGDQMESEGDTYTCHRMKGHDGMHSGCTKAGRYWRCWMRTNGLTQPVKMDRLEIRFDASERVELCGAKYGVRLCGLSKGHAHKHCTTDTDFSHRVFWEDPTPTAFDKAWGERQLSGELSYIHSKISKREAQIVFDTYEIEYRAGWRARGKAVEKDLAGVATWRKALDKIPELIHKSDIPEQ